MALGVAKGEEITIKIDGEDEENFMQDLLEVFEKLA